MKIIVTITPTDLVTNSLLSSFCPFSQTKIKKQVGGLVTRSISDFSLWWVALSFRAMPKLICFYKGIFLHVIPVRMIVSRSDYRFYTLKQPLELFCKKKGVAKNFENFTWKHLCWILILIKLQALCPATLFKRDSNTVAFLWIFRNAYE